MSCGKPLPSPEASSAAPSAGANLLKDSGIAAALVAALAVVYAFDYSAAAPDKPQSPDVQVVVREEAEPAPPPPVKHWRLGVTPYRYDDMGKLLQSLGEGYKYQIVELEDLLDEPKLGDFDILFLTCSGVPKSWLGKRLEDGPREGTETFAGNRAVLAKVGNNLRQFVERGGTLYASDWQFQLVNEAFPELIDRAKVNTGQKQTLTADVVDAGLRDLIGSQIELRFDMPAWYPAAFHGKEVTVLLRGPFETTDGDRAEAPLLVKFPHGNGTVIFTSFHNEKQNSELELKLLRYLVFAAVTAQTESQITKTMVAGGFSPASKNLLSASAEAPSVTQRYQCKKPGPIQFVLGFENQGAQLRLTVVGPDGKKHEQEGAATFTLSVPEAAVGEWKYTVTAVKVPYQNFPFTLTIGEK
jgi:hypothetical protein